ncbi:MAG: hypothetical protein JW827_02315 [Spirochaetes bacterium]|nr:hypothetical protein [Spirochaetota bacterium]
MRKAFIYYCPRANYIKLYGPVIKAQTRMYPDIKPIIFIPKPVSIRSLQEKDDLHYLYTLFKNIDIIQGKKIESLLQDYGVMALINIGYDLTLDNETIVTLKKKKVKFCSLGYIGEELMQIIEKGSCVLEMWDVATTLSSRPVNILKGLNYENIDPAQLKKLKAIGFVELDQIEDFDKDMIKRKYNIPLDKKIIYFSTAPYFHFKETGHKLNKLFRYFNHFMYYVMIIVFGPYLKKLGIEKFISYKKILSIIRKSAKEQDFLIVAKTRGKHHDPRYVTRNVDFLFTDEGYYPFRTLELMYISDYYIGFQSAAIIESIFSGKYSMTLLPFPNIWYEIKKFYPIRKAVWEKVMWDTQNVSQSYRIYKKGVLKKFEADLDNLGRIKLDKKKRNDVVKTILEYDDFKASERFLKLIAGEIKR